MSGDAIAAISAISAATVPETTPLNPHAAAQSEVSFSQLFFDGVERVNHKVVQSDTLVQSFILDDSVPPHRVIYALEQSHLSLQMMLQVRNRLVEGYQEIMRMQL